MRWRDQGVAPSTAHTVVPRTLVFLLRGAQVLLLRGAPDKARWAGLLNGVGGQVERGEDLLAAARREVWEETGLSVVDLRLRGLVHISGPDEAPGVMLFIFLGSAPSAPLRGAAEGSLEWHDLFRLPNDVVDDLPELLPRLLEAQARGSILFGSYYPGLDGELVRRFSCPGESAPLTLAGDARR